MKKYIRSIGVDVILAALFYLWQFRQVEGAGNVFIFFMWLLIACRLLVGLYGSKKDFPPRPKALNAYITALAT